MNTFKQAKKKERTLEEKYPALTEEDYLVIAKKVRLNEKQAYRYSQFMKRRFPEERHIPYAQEWAKRFKSENPESYMDSESLRINDLVKESMF
jgi:hypothetical protein